jgi:hypothetical protein
VVPRDGVRKVVVGDPVGGSGDDGVVVWEGESREDGDQPSAVEVPLTKRRQMCGVGALYWYPKRKLSKEMRQTTDLGAWRAAVQ